VNTQFIWKTCISGRTTLLYEDPHAYLQYNARFWVVLIIWLIDDGCVFSVAFACSKLNCFWCWIFL
jgi:hypothetical protein